MLISALLLGLSSPGHALSLKEPSDKPAAVKKDKCQKYLDSAESLRKGAENLEQRISKLPEAQQNIARNLVSAKRELADIKTEAASLWKEHLGELPEEFKPKLREAQSKHSALTKEFYRIGREIKEARKASSTTTNQIAPASVLGR